MRSLAALLAVLAFLTVLGSVEAPAQQAGLADPKGLAGRVQALEMKLAAAQNDISQLQDQLAFAQSLRKYVHVDPNPINGLAGPHVIFEGANVHVRSGSGATDDNGKLTGLGNLIVGYNEISDLPRLPNGSPSVTADRVGSHNMVVGPKNEYTSYGGFIAGSYNAVSSKSSSVSAGRFNTATGDYSSVSGGEGNGASGNSSSVSGGGENGASGDFSSVGAGRQNGAGPQGTASGLYASVSGGAANAASGDFSSVSGGVANAASGFRSSVSGGFLNAATFDSSSVSGGLANTASFEWSSVSGGEDNNASGPASSVCGGEENTASGQWSAVSGGQRNVASGLSSSVSGGGGFNVSDGNTAVGRFSSVSGGRSRSTPIDQSWAAGGLFQSN